MPSLQVNDIELYYESHGAGDPLVLIGGLGLSVADMRTLIELRAQFQASGSYDATARLGEITQPTLIVHGRADRIAPLALAREMHNAIPGSRFALLGGGHLISLPPHRQQQYLATVLAFLPPSKPPAAA